MKLRLSHSRQDHARQAFAQVAGRLLATGLMFNTTAPAVDAVFSVSAQTQTSYYNPRTNPFEADQTIKDIAVAMMDYSPRDRISALFKRVKTSSTTGLKAANRTGPPRTAATTIQKSGNPTELASVVLAVIGSMNEMGAGIKTEALVVHFKDTAPEKECLLIRVTGLVPVIIDPQAPILGIARGGSYDVVLKLTPQQAAEVYHRDYGDYLRDAGMLSEAIRAYKRALEIFPGDPYVHQNLGAIYVKKGDTEAANLHFHTADSLAPGRYAKARTESSYYQELGKGGDAYNTGRWSDCEAHFNTALQKGRELGHEDTASIKTYLGDCAKHAAEQEYRKHIIDCAEKAPERK